MNSRFLLSTTAFAALLIAAPAIAADTVPAPEPGAQAPQKKGSANREGAPMQDASTEQQGSNQQQSDQGQPATQGGIADIVVTAQRREESAQDVPIAISAFSADALEERGVSNTLELGQFVPNLIAQNNTGLGSANAFYLRGLGNTETIPTFDPPVGTYVDDIYISRQNANNFNLFDVKRVEVLRGPQGTLFGRNTTGGAVNIILRKPEFNEVNGYAEIGYGSYNKKLARASVDLPLAKTLAIKVSGYWQDDDGYTKNVTTGHRINDNDGWGARLGIRGKLSDNARWNASYAYIEANGENLLNYDCNPADRSECDGRFASTGLPEGRHLDSSPYAPLQISGRKANFGLGNYTQTHLVTSNLGFDLGPNTTLNLITGYVAQAQQYALDFSDGRGLPSLSNPQPPVQGLPQGGFDIINDGQSNQFTQEIKLDGSLGNGFVDYVAGLFYIHENNRTDFATTFGLAPNVSLLLGDRILRNSTDSYAGYAQADFNVTDRIKLTGGIRYTHETKKFDIQDNRASCNDGTLEASCLDTRNLIAPSGVAIPTEQTVNIWTPRFALNFRPIDNVLLFASATRGFKSGGWNARGTAPNALLPFDPEKVWSYEAGVKSDLFDRRVRANVTFYWLDVSDLQTPSGLLGPNGAITFLTRNFADYRNRGIETELTFQPIDPLTLYVNGSYQDDEYKINRDAPSTGIYGIQSVAAQQADCQAQLSNGLIPGGGATSCAVGIVDANGDVATPVRTPDFTLSLGGNYRFDLGNDMSLVPSLNASWHSDQEVQTSNFTIYSGAITGASDSYPANPYGGDNILQGSFSPSAWLINANLTLNGPDRAWQLTAGCTNCLDEEFIQSSLANTTYINTPRMWTVRAKYNF